MAKRTENQETAMLIFEMVKDARGGLPVSDVDRLAEAASRLLNTVIHLGLYVQQLEQEAEREGQG